MKTQSSMVKEIEVKGETGCSQSYTEVRGLVTRGTRGKWGT